MSRENEIQVRAITSETPQNAVAKSGRRRVILGALAALGLGLADGAVRVARAAGDPPLVIGIFPRRHATLTTELFTPLAAYLSRELGRRVTLETPKDFDGFWEAVTQERYDIVHFNQFHYIRSADLYYVIVHNEEFGTGSVAGALYVRKDSGVTKVEQLRGRKIVFGGGKDAMMSYILPRYLLLQAGLTPNDFESVFAKNPPNSLISTYHKQADAGGAGDILIDLPVVKDVIDSNAITHLAMTERLVHLPWAVSKKMPQPLARQLQSLLVGLKSSDEGRAILSGAQMTGFAASTDADFDAHRRIVRTVMPELELPR